MTVPSKFFHTLGPTRGSRYLFGYFAALYDRYDNTFKKVLITVTIRWFRYNLELISANNQAASKYASHFKSDPKITNLLLLPRLRLNHENIQYHFIYFFIFHFFSNFGADTIGTTDIQGCPIEKLQISCHYNNKKIDQISIKKLHSLT